MLARGLQIRKMFDSFTRSKFYTKCKSLIKITKTRVEASRKKKNAVAKYLKNDIADLLRTGFDSNAYGRAEGLILEQNLIAAYKYVEDFCDCISANLKVLDKQKECPKECREAIQSLMYAAARLAEFPELRDLRSLFTHRYGDCLELFINKQFSELLNPRPATKEMKLLLLGDVAQEFSINWDPNLLEQNLICRHVGSNNHPEEGGNKKMKTKDAAAAASLKFKYKHEEDGKRDSLDHGTSAENLIGTSEAGVASHVSSSSSNSSGSESTDRDSSQPSSSSMGTTTSTSSRISEDKSKIPYRFLPPPYVRTRLEKQQDDGAESAGSESKPTPRSVRRRQQMMKSVGEENAGGSVETPLNLKSPPYFGSLDGGSGMVLGRSRKAGIWKASDDEEEEKDDEEMQQSKKRGHYYERHNTISKLKPLSWRSRDESSGKEGGMEDGGAPGSAPPFGKNATSSASTSSNGGTGRWHGRSLSAESKVCGHVHPNLPDYDSLAARIAAFMGK
ncbi:IST1-like protein [Linum perenne]